MFMVMRPFGSSVPDDVFEPPVLALPKLTRNVPVPGVLFALRTVKVTVKGTPMFTRAGPLYVMTLPSASVSEVPTGGATVGTAVRMGVRPGACVATGVPPGACVGTGVPPGACVVSGFSPIAVAAGSAETATDGSALTPGAYVGSTLALGELCVPATTAAAPPPTMRSTRTTASKGAGLLFLAPVVVGATRSGILYAPCHCAASSRPRGARTVAIHSLPSGSKKYVWIA